MPNILCDTKNMTREEWLQMRKSGIGGSDAAILCGINKWKTPIGLYLDKIGEIEVEPDEDAAERMYWGNVLEDVVAQEFKKVTNKKIRRRNYMFQSENYPFMIANIDRDIIGENAGLEVKTSGSYALKDWEGDNIPQYYIIQCQHYIEVMGWDRMYICCLIGGQKFVMHTIEKDQELINYLIDLERNFWEKNVLQKIPPAIDGSEAAGELINSLYPAALSNQTLTLSDDNAIYAKEIEAIAEQIKKLDEQKSLYENKIKMIMGNFDTATVGDYKITWKDSHRNSFDTKSFRKDYESLYQQYSNDITFRKFSLKNINKKG